MDSDSKAMVRIALVFALAVLLMPGLAHSSGGVCGAAISGSGTCSGGQKNITCGALRDIDCCEEVAGCVWDEYGGYGQNCKRTDGHARPVVACGSYNDNPSACSMFHCTWTPAGAPPTGSCPVSSGQSSYGESCSSDANCATCLVCDTASHKCTQRPGVCTTIPEAYTAPVTPLPNNTNASTPVNAIAWLEAGSSKAVVGSGSNLYKTGWFSDWKITGIIGIAIMFALISLAAMIGKAFNLTSLTAFANTEIRQVLISALLLVGLIALVAFMDQIAASALAVSDLPVVCNSFEPCYITASKYYLTTLYDTAEGYASNELKESIKVMKRASYGYNLNVNTIYALFAGLSMKLEAGESLPAERHGTLFSNASKLMASLLAQRYFIDVISFGIAPVFLLMGILLRTFFFTRKLGGLMLAIAISLFIVYPLTFVFAWYTLNVTVYGERTLAVSEPGCPSECTGTYPLAFFVNPQDGQLMKFDTTQAMLRAGINKSNWATGGPDISPADGKGDFPGLTSCSDLSGMGISENACPDCPDFCRDVPFPAAMPGCNITKCAACNPGCKIARQRLTCNTDPVCAGKCPLSCRTNVSRENKCFADEKGGVLPANLSVNCGGCSKYPAWCRFLVLNRTDNRTYPAYNDTACKSGSLDISNDPACPSQCSYINSLGSNMLCSDLCSYKNAAGAVTICPEQCRVPSIANTNWTRVYDTTGVNASCNSNPDMAKACAACPVECEIEVPTPPISPDPPALNCAPYPTHSVGPELCLACPEYCRFSNFSFILPISHVSFTNGLPNVCVSSDISCSSGGSPVACNNSCNIAPPTPLICRPFDAANFGSDHALCKGCPDNARYKVRYTKDEPSYYCDANGLPVVITAAPGGEHSIVLSNPSPNAGAAKLSSAGGSGGAIRFSQTMDSVAVDSARISPNESVYAWFPLSGYCTATYVEGGNQQASGANSNPALAHKPGTLYLDGSGNAQLSGTIYFASHSLIYQYRWYNNSVLFSNGTTCGPSGCPSGTEEMLSTIPGSNVHVGDVWTFSCMAYNGSVASTWLNSTPVTITENPGELPCTVNTSKVNLTENTYYCSDSDCSISKCQANPFYVDLPNQDDDPNCMDALQTGCPYGCRVLLDDGMLAPECSACAAMKSAHPQCFVGGGISAFPNVPMCSEYLGNGPMACHSSVCNGLTNQSACNGAPTGSGCAWQGTFCESNVCLNKNQNDCTGSSCSWKYLNEVPINQRTNLQYAVTSSCRQCPENCRINGYSGDCGVNVSGVIDCSIANCGTACRTSPQPQPPAHAECQPYPTQGNDCAGCPALCRRSIGLMGEMGNCPSECDPDKCSDNCRIDDPPKKACDGCLDCDLDCNYFPAIRTDCSEICSDEALAGPVSIAPDAFIQSLPGASTTHMEIRNIGVLMVPALILPLFCIVIVVSFIRVLSPMLGGDIEIPGLGKII